MSDLKINTDNILLRFRRKTQLRRYKLFKAERHLIDFIIHDTMAKDGKYRFVDVGSNKGIFSKLVMYQMQGNCEIFAFEPELEHVMEFHKELQNPPYPTGEVHLYNIGLWSSQTNIPFYHRDYHEYSGIKSKEVSSYIQHKFDVDNSDIRTVYPLDDFITGDIDLLKIDVEGGEYEVLVGSTGILSNQQARTIVIEYHRCATKPLKDLVALLEDYDYTVTGVLGRDIKYNSPNTYVYATRKA